MKLIISINNIANACKELRRDATACTPTLRGEYVYRPPPV